MTNNKRVRAFVKRWCVGHGPFIDEVVANDLEDACVRVLSSFFESADNDVLEEAAKSFCDPMVYLHHLLCIRRGVDQVSLTRRIAAGESPKDLRETLNSVNDRVRVEIQRKERHWMLFLRACRDARFTQDQETTDEARTVYVKDGLKRDWIDDFLTQYGFVECSGPAEEFAHLREALDLPSNVESSRDNECTLALYLNPDGHRAMAYYNCLATEGVPIGTCEGSA